MSVTLYQLADEFKPIHEQLEKMLLDEEIDSQTFLDTLEASSVDLMVKAENTAKYVLHLQNLTQGIDEAIKRMQQRKKAIANRADSLKRYLASSLQHAGFNKYETADIRIGFRKSEATIIKDESKIPAQFKKVKTIEQIDKTALKKAIKSGEVIEGATIEVKQNIQIK